MNIGAYTDTYTGIGATLPSCINYPLPLWAEGTVLSSIVCVPVCAATKLL